MQQETRDTQGNPVEYTQYIGFDLGDGESAVAWLRAGSMTAPQLLEVGGRKSFQSILGVHPTLGTLIGQEAYQMTDIGELMVRFKHRFLEQPAASGDAMLRFAQAVRDRLEAAGFLRDPAHTAVRVGCPSGWEEEARARYLALLREAGLPNVDVISESRAAFLYMRESGELPVNPEEITEPTLIIDAGSSTMDFTFIQDLTEHALSDFGENQLGAGLIDGALWERNLARSPHRKKLEKIFAAAPQYAARCELEARRVKEMYFTYQGQGMALPCESSVKIYYQDPPLTVDITCTDADMREILRQPMEALGGLSFLETYDHALERAKEALAATPPSNLLLTGGAARMGLVAEGCVRAFPEAKLLRGSEPEFAIARGLCYALRIDERTRGFQAAVQDLLASGEIERLLTESLPDLFAALSGPLAGWVIEDVAMPVMLAWQRGEIKTLDEVSARISEEMTRQIARGGQNTLLAPEVHQWMGDLEQEMSTLTDPICDQYGIRRSALKLPARVQLDPLALPFSPGAVVGVDSMLTLTQGVVGLLTAILLGGGGTALLATGPLGSLAGFLLGILVTALGRKKARQLLEGANLPRGVRILMPPFMLRRLLRGKKDLIAEHIQEQLMEGLYPPSPQVQRLMDEVVQSIRDSLEKLARKAFLLIH